MERPSSHDGIADSDFPIYPYNLFMSRVIKPFCNTAVSVFYSLVKIATNYFSVSLSLYIKVLLHRPTKQLEVNYMAFHTPFFPQVLNKGSKNGYCFSNVCFILKVFLLLGVKIWC